MDLKKRVEEVKEEKSFPLTMFPLKSMLGNFLLMYLMAVSMPFSVSRGRRDFGSAHVCDRRRHNRVLLIVALSQTSVALITAFCSDLPVDLGSTVRAAGRRCDTQRLNVFTIQQSLSRQKRFTLIQQLNSYVSRWESPTFAGLILLAAGENNWRLRRLTALTNFLLALPFCSKKKSWVAAWRLLIVSVCTFINRVQFHVPPFLITSFNSHTWSFHCFSGINNGGLYPQESECNMYHK